MSDSTPRWLREVRSLAEMEARHEERMKDVEAENERRDLVEPDELLRRLWSR